MNKKYGLYMIFGLIIGADLGIFFGPAIGNTPLAIVLGALGNIFSVWFLVVLIVERSKAENKTDNQ
jgi:hypothetical protein